MPTYGVTPQGFLKKDGPTIASEIDAGLKKILGDSAGTEPDGSIPPSGFAGQIKQLMVDRETAMWDGMQAVYSSWDTRANGDESQDATAMITGAARQPSRASTAALLLTGDPATVVPAGKVVSSLTSNARFDTDVDTTPFSSTANWLPTHGYVVGDLVTNGGNIYTCITSGTSAGSGGPAGTGTNITDGTVHWRFCGQGTGTCPVSSTCEVDGPVGALSGTLTVIATPVPGWRGVINLLDATVGQSLESNTAFRLRRDAELQASGNATVDAIRAALLSVDETTNNPVTSCRVFHNDSDVTDADGLPPHSVEVMVLGGADADVALAIFENISAGTNTHGNTTVTVQDSLGNNQVINFTRPVEVDIWVIGNVTYDPKVFPTDLGAGTVLLQEQIVFYGDAYPIGRSVRSSALEAQLFDGNSDDLTGPVPGVLDVTSLLIGLSNPPVSSATVPIAARQIAKFDTSRVTINLTPGTP